MEFLQILTFFIAIFALLVAGYSARIAREARSDSRKVLHLDLEPDIKSRGFTVREEIPGFIVLGSNCHLTIQNDGPIDAIQLLVRLGHRRFNSSKGFLDATVSGTDAEWKIDELAPGKSENIGIDCSLIDVSEIFPEVPAEEKLVELRISYRRDSDRKMFVKRGVYFFNPRGECVNDRHGSVSTPEYDAIKKAAQKSWDPTRSDSMGVDILEDITPEN